MDVKILGGTGLHASETRAVALMKEKLRSSWKAYASLLVIDDQGSMDIDTLIITHDRLLLVELKEWNGKLESSEGKWYINGIPRGKSPYEIKRVHAQRVRKLLELELKHKLKGYSPHVEAHVVLCGNATPENLSSMERKYVHTLDEFLTIAKTDNYENLTQKTNIAFLFEPISNRGKGFSRPNSEESLKIFQDFFSGPNIKPKDFEYYNYIAAKDVWFEHKEDLYKEYKGQHYENPDIGLLRRWDLNNLGIAKSNQKAWSEIILRETRINSFIRNIDNKAADYMLRSLIPLGVDDITEDTTELYELRKTYKRLDEFISLNASKWTTDNIIDIIRSLIVPFAELHGAGISHRDIDSHNMWFASDKNCILVSGFSSAFFPEKGTISDLRYLLQSSHTKLPEDIYNIDIKDPFKIDVFMLGTLAYQLCFNGKQITKEDGVPVWSENNDDKFNGKLDTWFAKSLDWEPRNRFTNASDMLAEFNRLTKNELINNNFTDLLSSIKVGSFYKSDWNPFTFYQKYPPSGENNISGSKFKYKTSIEDKVYLCKAWNNIQITSENLGQARKVLNFKQRAEALNKNNFSVPTIYDYGYSPFSGTLFVITEYVDGVTWSDSNLKNISLDSRKQIAKLLITSISNCHYRGIAHGDLHPQNIILNITDENIELYLIDMIDFSLESEPFNIEYGPQNPSITDSFGRDRYAIYKLLKELFQEDTVTIIQEEIDIGFSCKDNVPISLDPLLTALENEDIEKEVDLPSQEFIQLSRQHHSFPTELTLISHESNGYFFNCKWNRFNNSILDCYITGTNQQLKVELNPEKRTIDRLIYTPDISFSELVSASSKSQTILSIHLSIVNEKPSEISDLKLINSLLSLDIVLDELEKKYSDLNKDHIIDKTDTEDLVEIDIPISKAWQALSETELELRFKLIIDSNDITESKMGNFLIKYSQPLTQNIDFDLDDTVHAYMGNEEYQIGQLDLTETNLDYIAVKPSRSFNKHLIRSGEEISLESIKSKASRDRKNKALNRVINNEAIINNLPSYFDINAKAKINILDKNISAEEIRSLYDSPSSEMNTQQVEAFKHLLSCDPVCVLQGPPGTGKTSFISKFIHYLFVKEGVKNILLVGQSHTAVDNVAIKARELCNSKKYDLQIVRIGHESMIDTELMHTHPTALQRQILHKFHREYEQRVRALSRHLLLPIELIDELTNLHRSLAPLIDSLKLYEKLLNQEKEHHLKSEKIDDYESRIKDRREYLNSIVMSRFNQDLDLNFNADIWEQISNHTSQLHSINNPAALKRLKGLLFLSEEWMGVLRTGEANYDKFLVKSKQLVCGTLVGIGKKRIEIENVEFDWVIIDEAGRAQALELLIAMQSAQRVLLVGDHKQLPPLYEKEQLRLAAKKINSNIDIFTESDFERAFKITKGITLNTQYRMVKPIGDIVSHCFYDGKLETGRNNSAEWFNVLKTPLNKAVTWIDSASESGELNDGVGKYYNLNELNCISNLLKDLCDENTIQRLKQLVSNEQAFPIGIITMYRTQKEKIENELSKAEWARPIRELIKIDTVDSYQGQQNSIIILSLVRDNTQLSQGFLKDSSRINVAISRAQERLVIVGSKKMWDSQKIDSALSKVSDYISGKISLGDDNYQYLRIDEINGVSANA